MSLAGYMVGWGRVYWICWHCQRALEWTRPYRFVENYSYRKRWFYAL